MLLASRLQEPAFNVYMRLSNDDKKDVEKIKTELRREYETGNRDREQALSLLASRLRKDEESLQDFAFSISRLVRLAYPNAAFTEAIRGVHEKDYFVRGLHPELQLKVKTLEKFDELGMKDLINNAVRFEVAGVGSTKVKIKTEINEVRESTDQADGEADRPTLDSRLQSLEERIAKLSVDRAAKGRNYNQRNNSPSRLNRNSTTKRKCWNCGDTSHFVRNCSKRFCQSCGKAGHDAWSKSCPKHT